MPPIALQATLAQPPMNPPATSDPDGRAAAARAHRSVFEPFQHTLYTACWSTGMLAHAAVWLQNIAVPFLVFELTGSATWLGVAAVASHAPALIGSPLGGVLADRYPRRGLLLATLVLKIAVSFGFYILWQLEALHLSVMMALLIVNGLAHTVHLACFSSFIPQIVPRSILASAVRLLIAA